jgi:hypothetical protein
MRRVSGLRVIEVLEVVGERYLVEILEDEDPEVVGQKIWLSPEEFFGCYNPSPPLYSDPPNPITD